jgi:hypothetical protein
MEKGDHEYVIMDNNGMIVEKSNNFNQNVTGYVTDIIQKARNVLNTKDTLNSVEIFFENQTFLIKDNCSTNLNITTVLENK